MTSEPSLQFRRMEATSESGESRELGPLLEAWADDCTTRPSLGGTAGKWMTVSSLAIKATSGLSSAQMIQNLHCTATEARR